jgi:hypothetical protein
MPRGTANAVTWQKKKKLAGENGVELYNEGFFGDFQKQKAKKAAGFLFFFRGGFCNFSRAENIF